MPGGMGGSAVDIITQTIETRRSADPSAKLAYKYGRRNTGPQRQFSFNRGSNGEKLSFSRSRSVVWHRIIEHSFDQLFLVCYCQRAVVYTDISDCAEIIDPRRVSLMHIMMIPHKSDCRPKTLAQSAR